MNNIWTNDVELVIPFYDSFIFNNNLYLKKCIPDFSDISPTFWVERNNLPFDTLLERKVIKFSKSLQRPVRLVKSIFYKNKDDAEALQTYKILCNRNFGKAATLSNPRLEHFGSKEFCFESYLESKNERDAS